MKFLIFSLSCGGGHDAAANAAAAALRDAGAEAAVYDCYAVIRPSLSKAVCGFYVWLVKHLPWLFGIFYNASYNIPRLNGKTFVYDINKFEAERLARFIQKENPDAILTSHIFSAQQLTHLKKNGKITQWIGGIITDYDVQPFWNDTEMDMIFTPTESLSERYEKFGVNGARLVTTGIPVDPSISPEKDIAKAKREAGLEENRRHVLVAGGSMGAGKMHSTVENLLKTLDENVQIIAVCGNNLKLKRKFMRMNVPESRLKVEGFVKPLCRLMRACDVVISKPGGLSTTEAFELKRPLVVVHPIHGVESHNARFLRENGVALCPKTDDEVSKAVSEILSNPEITEKMMAAREKCIPSGASRTIADTVIREAKKNADIV
ncbi:MAG: UDP-N-acetylglucosamine 2-epimerase [Clostridia bacterium]|nr:UDP-N-acetylglucosamine 2-epimerase [Clostridia bacterium]